MNPKDIHTRKVIEGDMILHLPTSKKFRLKLAMSKGINGDMWIMGEDGELFDAKDCEYVPD